jgi:hypothetical protein
MPYYNVSSGQIATNASGGTAVNHFRSLTVANQAVMQITQIQLIGKANALQAMSGIALRMTRYGTPSTVGGAVTPQPLYPGNTASTTWFSSPTAGATPTIVKTVGCGVGGPGAWVADNPAAAIFLLANGGANGNLDTVSFCGASSLNFEVGIDFNEGVY